MSPEIAVAAVTGLAAATEDLVRRTVSNWIPITALAGGLFCHAWNDGWRGAGAALLGAIGGFGIFLIFYLLGGMGGGDVKLMSGFGAVLGIGRLLEAAMWTAIVGGVVAAIVIGVERLRRVGAQNSGQGQPPKSIPYAPAIAAGAWLALIPKG